MAKCYFDNQLCSGSIFRDRNKNLWTFKGRFIDSTGKRQEIKISAKLKKTVIDKVKMKIAAVNVQNSIQHITLRELHDRYIQKISSYCRDTTIETYEERMTRVLNKFGDCDISTINTLDLEHFLDDLAKPLKRSAAANNETGEKSGKIARSTVNAIINYLKRCFKMAVKEKLIPDNPADGLERLTEDNPDTIALDADQARLLLETAHDGNYIYNGIKSPKYYKKDVGTEYYIRQYYLLILMLLSAGIRIGEALGLPWDNVDFANKTIYIRQQLVHHNGKPVLSQLLKTESSHRDIVLDDIIMNELAEFQKYQQGYSDMLGDHYNNRDNLVFTNTEGNYVRQDGFRKNYFTKMVREAALPKELVIHGLRRTTATILVDAGANIRAVADLMGHKSTRTLIDIYTKTTKQAKAKIADIMSDKLHHND